MLITKNKIKFERPADIREIDYPKTPSQAYELGYKLNQLALQTFELFTASCQDIEDKDIIKKYADYTRDETNLFYKYYKYELNREIGHFYQSNGLQIDEINIDYNKGFINNQLNSFFFKTNKSLLDINLSILKNLQTSFTLSINENINMLCSGIRDNIYLLFKRLANVYPVGEIREVFNEMAKTNKEVTFKISGN